MRRLRVGVIGVGHLGTLHARMLSQLDGAELVGLFDRDLERAQTVARELGIHRYDSVESLIEQPASMSHASYDRADRLAHGIRDELIRLSVGLEAFEDLRDDLAAALGTNGAVGGR